MKNENKQPVNDSTLNSRRFVKSPSGNIRSKTFSKEQTRTQTTLTHFKHKLWSI